MNQASPTDEKLLMFIRGELSPEEQERLEHEIEVSPELKAQMEALVLAQAAVWKAGRKQEANRLKSLYRNQKQATIVKPMFGRRLIAIAASLLLIAAVAFLVLRQSPASMNTLYADHYERPAAPELLAVTPLDSLPVDSLRKLAYANFNAGKIDQASALLIQLKDLIDQDNASEIQLFLGVCYLEANKPQKAIDAFQKMTENTEAAQWYTLLAYIKLEDKASVEKAINVILSDPEHFYYKDAQEIQQAL
jgi:tetratricopeptide (TPR) repeat protein